MTLIEDIRRVAAEQLKDNSDRKPTIFLILDTGHSLCGYLGEHDEERVEVVDAVRQGRRVVVATRAIVAVSATQLYDPTKGTIALHWGV